MPKENRLMCLAQGLGGHGAHMRWVKAAQPFTKACQASPATLHGFLGEVAAAVQATALTHGFFEVFHAVDLVVFITTNLKAETVGAEVYGSKGNRIIHLKCQLAAQKAQLISPHTARR